MKIITNQILKMKPLLYINLIPLLLGTTMLIGQSGSKFSCLDFRYLIDKEKLLEIAEDKIEQSFKDPDIIKLRKFNELRDLRNLDYESFNRCINLFLQKVKCDEIQSLFLFQYSLRQSVLYGFHLVISTKDGLDYYYHGDLLNGEIEFKGIKKGSQLNKMLRMSLSYTSPSIESSHYLYFTYYTDSNYQKMDFSPFFSIVDLNIVEILLDALFNSSLDSE